MDHGVSEVRGRDQGAKRPLELTSEQTAHNPKRVQRAQRVPRNYFDLYNTEARNHAQISPSGLSISQIGSVVWHPGEKDAFFHALDRYGRDNVHRIAKLVGSKSEPEIEDYLRLLLRASGELAQHVPRNCVRHADIPAALEVNVDNELRMERHADDLVIAQSLDEKKALRLIYGDKLWLIERSMAKRIKEEKVQLESCLAAPDALGMDAIAALKFLDVHRMLEVSHKVFMNSSEDANNWRTYRGVNGEPKRPAIRLPTLVDFYRLSKLLLERLMLAATQCASTRLRTYPDGVVRAIEGKDVEAAVQILGLKSIPFPEYRRNFWIDAVLRNKIHGLVKDPDHGTTTLSLKDTQIYLQTRNFDAEAFKSGPMEESKEGQVTEDIIDTEMSSSSTSGSDDESEESHSHLEQLDQSTSAVHNDFLREISQRWVSQNAPGIEEEDPPAPVRYHQPARQYPVSDWRETVEYQSLWEQSLQPSRPRSLSGETGGDEIQPALEEEEAATLGQDLVSEAPDMLDIGGDDKPSSQAEAQGVDARAVQHDEDSQATTSSGPSSSSEWSSDD